MVEIDGTTGPSEPRPRPVPRPLPGSRRARDLPPHVARRSAAPGAVCGLHLRRWQIKDTVYLEARGVSFAVLTSGRWDEVAPFVAFMGYAQPWSSVQGVEAPITTDGRIVCLPARRRPCVSFTYRTTRAGATRPADGCRRPAGGMTPYGQGIRKTTPRAGPRMPLLLVLGYDADRNATWARPPPRAAVDPPQRDPRRGPGQRG